MKTNKCISCYVKDNYDAISRAREAELEGELKGEGDAWLSLGKGNTIGFVSGLRMDGDEGRREQAEGGKEGDREYWERRMELGYIWEAMGKLSAVEMNR